MDSLTHIALGACTGEILLGKKLGKKALLWGIIAQNLPDIDSLAALFVPADKALLIHRGITHSLPFAVIAGLCLALLAKKIHHKTHLSLAILASFFCFQLALHDLLDTCNSYGTGLLEPFSHHRFSINLLYVADPLFTISLLIAALFLILKNRTNPQRTRAASAGIIIPALYLCFAGFNKMYINRRAEASFIQQGIHPSDYFSTPAPFNCMLWYIVVNADSSYYTAYSSIYDVAKQRIVYELYAQNHSLIKQANNTIVKNLALFAGSYYTVSTIQNNLFVNVLRFEQVQGWRIKQAPFAFSYSLSPINNQAMLLQKGRLSGWNAKSLQLYLYRIAGKQTIDKQ